MKKILLSLVALSALSLTACAPTKPATTAKAAPAPVAVVAPPALPPPAEEKVAAPAESAEVAEAPEPPADQTDFKGDGFEVSTPAAGWRQIRTPSTAILGLVNPELRNLIIVVTEPTKLNTVTMRDDVAAKLLKGSPHATVIPNSKKNSIKNNGITFASFRVGTKQVGSPMKGWVWTTVQNGKAVTLLCSGAEDSDKTQEKACAAAFKSLKLTTNGK